MKLRAMKLRAMSRPPSPHREPNMSSPRRPGSNAQFP